MTDLSRISRGFSLLSVDLRERVVAAVAEDASFHRAAAWFGGSVSSVSRWSQRFAQQGHVAPKPTYGDDRLPAIEVHADLVATHLPPELGGACGTGLGHQENTSTRSGLGVHQIAQSQARRGSSDVRHQSLRGIMKFRSNTVGRPYIERRVI